MAANLTRSRPRTKSLPPLTIVPGVSTPGVTAPVQVSAVARVSWSVSNPMGITPHDRKAGGTPIADGKRCQVLAKTRYGHTNSVRSPSSGPEASGDGVPPWR